MTEIQNIYFKFLNYFPTGLHSLVSVALAVLLVYAVFKTLKRDFIYIIVLVVLLPASVPILKSIWEGIVVLIKFLLNTK